MIPLINGVSYGWSSIQLNLFGQPVAGIKSIDYTRKQEKKLNWGAGTEPVSIGYGRKSCEGSIELLLDEWKRIIAVSPHRDPLSIGSFDIAVNYGNSVADATQDTLVACEFMEDPFSAKEGDTSISVKIPLVIAKIER